MGRCASWRIGSPRWTTSRAACRASEPAVSLSKRALRHGRRALFDASEVPGQTGVTIGRDPDEDLFEIQKILEGGGSLDMLSVLQKIIVDYNVRNFEDLFLSLRN